MTVDWGKQNYDDRYQFQRAYDELVWRPTAIGLYGTDPLIQTATDHGGSVATTKDSKYRAIVRLSANATLYGMVDLILNPTEVSGSDYRGELEPAKYATIDYLINIADISTSGVTFAFKLASQSGGSLVDYYAIEYAENVSTKFYAHVFRSGSHVVDTADTGVTAQAGFRWYRLQMTPSELSFSTSDDGSLWVKGWAYTTTANFPVNKMCAKMTAFNFVAGANTVVDVYEMRTCQRWAV